MKMIDEADFDYSKFGYNEIDLGDDIIYSKLDIKYDDNKLGFKKGSYRILSGHNLYLYNETQTNKLVQYVVDVLNELTSKLKIKKTDKILICGLGNYDIVADSFGVETCKKILATYDIKSSITNSKICKIIPNVKMNTGLDTFTIVNGIIKLVNIKLIIVIDSLITKNIQRIGHSIQISTCGTTPGGGICNGKEISKQTTNVECMTIGIPFMIDLKSISSKVNKHIIVTPKDNFEMINFCSNIVSDAINLFFNPKLTKKEINELKRPI